MFEKTENNKLLSNICYLILHFLIIMAINFYNYFGGPCLSLIMLSYIYIFLLISPFAMDFQVSSFSLERELPGKSRSKRQLKKVCSAELYDVSKLNFSTGHNHTCIIWWIPVSPVDWLAEKSRIVVWLAGFFPSFPNIMSYQRFAAAQYA